MTSPNSDDTASTPTRSPYARILDAYPNARFLICGPRDPRALEYETPERDVAKVPLGGIGLDTVKRKPVPIDRVERFSETNFIGVIPGTCDVCAIDLDNPAHFDFLAETFPDAPFVPTGTNPRRGHFFVRVDPDKAKSIGNGKIYRRRESIGEVRCISGYIVLWNPEAFADAILSDDLPVVPASKSLGLTQQYSTGDRREKALDKYCDLLRSAPPGERHDTMVQNQLPLIRHQFTRAELQPAIDIFVSYPGHDEQEFMTAWDGAKEKYVENRGTGETLAQTADGLARGLAEQSIRIRFNTRAQQVEVLNPEDQHWTKFDDYTYASLVVLFQRNYLRATRDSVTHWSLSKDNWFTFITALSQEHAVDPFAVYLSRLEWDETPRLSTWIERLFKVAPQTPIDLVRWASRSILMSAVERALKPGCKVDTTIVLRGPIGIGKSSCLYGFFPPHYRDKWLSESFDFRADDKTVAEMCVGPVFIEFAELGGLRRAEVERVKAIASRQVDKARMAYGRVVMDFPRRSVMIGTANPGQYLVDSSGNRRFIPIDVEGRELNPSRLVKEVVTSNADQLWAEAYHRVVNLKESHMIPEEIHGLAMRAGEDLLVRTMDEDLIEQHEWGNRAWLLHEIAVKMGKLDRAVVVDGVETFVTDPAAKLSQQQTMLMSNSLRALGWQRTARKRLCGINTTWWIAPGVDVKTAFDETPRLRLRDEKLQEDARVEREEEQARRRHERAQRDEAIQTAAGPGVPY